jgi:SAM-dependent methyltransferase
VRTAPKELQHRFYSASAERYHAEFVRPDDEHYRALSMISTFMDGSGYRSVLDVGAGTGRGVKHFVDRHPEFEVRGVEPVEAMIRYAEESGGVPRGAIVEAHGEALPFDDERFDAVCELGILHHVAEPDAIVEEMTRVARRAVFLSDENRFARGGGVSRATKYALYRLGLWPWIVRLRTGGRGYVATSDGGVAYSYSVYDSLPTLGGWADQIFLVPTAPAHIGWFHPLFGATHILLCALRNG